MERAFLDRKSGFLLRGASDSGLRLDFAMARAQRAPTLKVSGWVEDLFLLYFIAQIPVLKKEAERRTHKFPSECVQ